MKIAFVYDAVYPWITGGAEKRIYELGCRLANKGHEVHLFGIKWWEGPDNIEYEGMFLHGLCKARNLYTINGRRSILTALIFAYKLFFPLKREKFDIIDISVFPYFSCFTAKFITQINKTCLVYTWHEIWNKYWYTYLGKIGFFGKIIEKLVSKTSHNNIAVSNWTKKNLIKLSVSDSHIEVIPNGINLKKIIDLGIKEFHNDFFLNYKKDYDLIFAGRLIKEKNVDVLLKAIFELKAVYPCIKCAIVGDGPEKSKLLTLIESLNIADNIEFFGFIDYNSLVYKIKSSKMLVLPSSREGFGMVVIEAFACGIPVITVNEENNAARCLVEDGLTGYVVKADATEISSSITKILNMEFDSYIKMSKTAFKKAQSYDWDIICNKLEEYYKGCL